MLTLFDIFLINILLNAVIFVIPLAVLTKFSYEKDLTSAWVWTIPFITIIGAYTDFWVFGNHAIGQSTALIIIGISYFFSVTAILGYRFITGLIMAAWAMTINYLAWKHFPLEMDVYFFRALWVSGVIVLAIIITLFSYNTLRVLARRAEPKRKDYLRQAFCTIATLLLLFFPFLYYRL